MVDDGIQGYMDNGIDDFEEAEEYQEDDPDLRKEKRVWPNIYILVARINDSM